MRYRVGRRKKNKETLTKPNILVLSSYFYPEGGGAEKYIYSIAKYIKEEFSTYIVSFVNEIRPARHYKEFKSFIQIKPWFKIYSVPLSPSFLINAVRALLKVDFSFLVINFHLPLLPEIGTLLGKLFRIPVVLVYHNDMSKNDPVADRLCTFYNWILKNITLKAADRIITPSPYCFHESKILKPFRAKLSLITPGVAIQDYSGCPPDAIHKRYSLADESKVILFVGVITSSHVHKGIDTLLEAFKMTKEALPSEPLYLVNVGRFDKIIEYYRDRVKKMKLEESVFFTGYLKEEELIGSYGSCYLLVLPSLTIQEGFGMVLIEAGACSKPVIGSSVGGVKYVIKNMHNGILVKPNDPLELSRAMIRLLKDKDLAYTLGKNFRNDVGNIYDWDLKKKEFIDCLCSLDK